MKRKQQRNFKKNGHGNSEIVLDFIVGVIAGLICGGGCKTNMKYSIILVNATPAIKSEKIVYKLNSYNIRIVGKALARFIGASLFSNTIGQIRNIFRV